MRGCHHMLGVQLTGPPLSALITAVQLGEVLGCVSPYRVALVRAWHWTLK